jgi:hypothetical protein
VLFYQTAVYNNFDIMQLLGASLLKALLASFYRLTKAYAKERPNALNLKELNFMQEVNVEEEN